MTTIDVLKRIAECNKNIKQFVVHEFPNQVLLQDRLKNWEEKEERHFKSSMKLRNQYHMPFWDSVMLCTFDNLNFSSDILQAALLHNKATAIKYISADCLDVFQELVNQEKRLAVSSLVILQDGQKAHIPMFDFHIPVSTSNFKVVQTVCLLLGLKHGFILNSGESYHYIGKEAVAWDELYILLAKALLYSPIIDKAWISHQLQERSCSLRIDKKHGVDTYLLMEY